MLFVVRKTARLGLLATISLLPLPRWHWGMRLHFIVPATGNRHL